MADDALGRATEKHMLQPGVPARPNDDQVRTDFAGQLADLVEGTSARSMCFRRLAVGRILFR